MSKHNVNRHERPRVVSVERKARALQADAPRPVTAGRSAQMAYSPSIRPHGPQATQASVKAQPPADYAPPPDFPPLGFIDAPTIHTAYAIVGITVGVLILLGGIAIGAAL